MDRHLDLDERMASGGQRAIAEAVKALPEETVSLAWRSSLNERLFEAAAARRKRQRLLFFLKPSAGLLAAGALAVGVLLMQPAATVSSVKVADHSIEASLVSYHQEASTSVDVAGAGLSPLEAANDTTRAGVATPPDWNESDVEGL